MKPLNKAIRMVGTAADQYVYLAEQPELLPTLAEWFYDEWGRSEADMSLSKMQSILEEYLNTDRIPLTIVTMRDSKPIASASLKIQEMETHPQYLHWLGSVYVHPQYRRQGVGSRIVQYAAGEAQKLMVQDLYLYTRNQERFYSHLGWQAIERPAYHGRTAIIMKRNLKVMRQKGK